MFVAHIVHMVQPIVGEANAVAEQRGAHAATTIMAGHDHVLYLQHIDCVLDYRQAIEIGVYHHIGDIAVNENLAGHQPDNFIGRHATVGAADPQILRRLLLGETLEESRILALDLLRPCTVIGKQLRQGFHLGS